MTKTDRINGLQTLKQWLEEKRAQAEAISSELVEFYQEEIVSTNAAIETLTQS